MKKSAIKTAIVFLTIGIMAIGATTTVMANNQRNQQRNTQRNTQQRGCCRGNGQMMMQGLMWDEEGNFLTRDAFEALVDELIAEGNVRTQDRAFMLERFDWCQNYGGGANGRQGACGGFNRRA